LVGIGRGKCWNGTSQHRYGFGRNKIRKGLPMSDEAELDKMQLRIECLHLALQCFGRETGFVDPKEVIPVSDAFWAYLMGKEGDNG
jgi:hypothetical protein